MLFLWNGFGDVINGVYVTGMFLENSVKQGFGSWGETLEKGFGGGCRGVIISGSDIVTKEESSGASSAFELGSERWRKHLMSRSLFRISICEFNAMRRAQERDLRKVINSGLR